MKKMLSLQGLISVLLLTSVPSWSASPVLDDKDLAEHADYGFMVGGLLDVSRQMNFKGEVDAAGKFLEICRESSLATVGFSAFGRMCLTVNIGSGSMKGTLAASASDPDFKTKMEFTTKPALVWGGKLGVQLYNEGCIRAMGAAQYHQSSMPVKMVSGTVSRRQFQLVPSYDTANNRLGLYVVPDVTSNVYVQPTQIFTADSIVSHIPHIMYEPAGVTVDFSQYELGLFFGYGQQHVMYVGAKIIGGVSSMTAPSTSLNNSIGQSIGPLFQAMLGVESSVIKMEATRNCYIAPVVGFCLCGKGLTIDVHTSWLAQQDLTLKAALAF